MNKRQIQERIEFLQNRLNHVRKAKQLQSDVLSPKTHIEAIAVPIRLPASKDSIVSFSHLGLLSVLSCSHLSLFMNDSSQSKLRLLKEIDCRPINPLGAFLISTNHLLFTVTISQSHLFISSLSAKSKNCSFDLKPHISSVTPFSYKSLLKHDQMSLVGFSIVANSLVLIGLNFSQSVNESSFSLHTSSIFCPNVISISFNSIDLGIIFERNDLMYVSTYSYSKLTNSFVEQSNFCLDQSFPALRKLLCCCTMDYCIIGNESGKILVYNKSKPEEQHCHYLPQVFHKVYQVVPIYDLQNYLMVSTNLGLLVIHISEIKTLNCKALIGREPLINIQVVQGVNAVLVTGRTEKKEEVVHYELKIK
ncbi:hypothetical protein GEMRC1_005308 [Eukaryota sp. GEM-RC1]